MDIMETFTVGSYSYGHSADNKYFKKHLSSDWTQITPDEYFFENTERICDNKIARKILNMMFNANELEHAMKLLDNFGDRNVDGFTDWLVENYNWEYMFSGELDIVETMYNYLNTTVESGDAVVDYIISCVDTKFTNGIPRHSLFDDDEFIDLLTNEFPISFAGYSIHQLVAMYLKYKNISNKWLNFVLNQMDINVLVDIPDLETVLTTSNLKEKYETLLKNYNNLKAEYDRWIGYTQTLNETIRNYENELKSIK